MASKTKAQKGTPKSLPLFCGATTCYDPEAKRMCRFVGTTKFGSNYICLLYRDKNGDYIKLNESNPNELEKSMLLRNDPCLAEIK